MRGGKRGESDRGRRTPSRRLPDFPPLQAQELEKARIIRRVIQDAEEASRRRQEFPNI